MTEVDGGIHVTGSGRAGAPPDVLILNAGVEVVAKDPGVAFDQAKGALADLRAAVRARGIDDSDLQTSRVDLYPTHDRNGKVNGHQAALGLTITVRDIAGSGAIIDAVTSAAGGHARLAGIRLDHSDPTSLVALARSRAVADARRRAQELADVLDRTVGRCVRVEEFGGEQPMPRMMAARGMPTAEMSVDGGEVEHVVTVSVVWDFAD